MTRKAIWLTAALALALVPGSDGGWIRPTTRAPCLPGIPERDYLPIDPSLPLMLPTQGVSFAGDETQDPVTKRKLRTFAMGKELRILHCSITQVVFAFDTEGNWVFNCQADQNPWFTTQPTGEPPATFASALKNIDTNRILRNEFTVTVRCLAKYSLKEAIKTTGKPAVAVVPMRSFWVQRGVPYLARESGAGAAALSQNYGLIDRVEFDLQVR